MTLWRTIIAFMMIGAGFAWMIVGWFTSGPWMGLAIVTVGIAYTVIPRGGHEKLQRGL